MLLDRQAVEALAPFPTRNFFSEASYVSSAFLWLVSTTPQGLARLARPNLPSRECSTSPPSASWPTVHRHVASAKVLASALLRRGSAHVLDLSPFFVSQRFPLA